jgi:hypothetical protein
MLEVLEAEKSSRGSSHKVSRVGLGSSMMTRRSRRDSSLLGKTEEATVVAVKAATEVVAKAVMVVVAEAKELKNGMVITMQDMIITGIKKMIGQQLTSCLIILGGKLALVVDEDLCHLLKREEPHMKDQVPEVVGASTLASLSSTIWPMAKLNKRRQRMQKRIQTLSLKMKDTKI